ncbi:MAG: class I SAM-dependent methyltransferase [Flavobacteriales bacterium]|nr:class I SAM-dependent methyltransferase [Flavobacteriales bacterium]
MEHSLETLKSCPSCGHKSFKNTLSCIDYTYSKDKFYLVKCSACNLLFTNPRPDELAIGKYYDSPEYVSHTDTNSGLLFTLYRIVKRYTLKQKRKSLEKFSIDKNILDYGAGSGDFSNELEQNNWNVSAYEPDHNARKKIEEKNSKIKLIEKLRNVETESKSVITLWHVLEHVHQLNETISEFHRILTTEGIIVIAVPNHTSYDASFYLTDWAAYDVPRHLYHFDPETLETLMSANGFRLHQIKAMWFDAFYVSLLSEKTISKPGILKTIFGWIRAFLIGSYSNIKTIISTKKCSSVTYVFKKAI